MHGSADSYKPSAYFLTHPTPTAGHKDVVRAIYHDQANQALYTGSEDGVVSGWSIASLSERLKVGDKDLDDAEDDQEDESDEGTDESEIETEESDDGMDVDEDEERESGPRNGPIIGAGSGADRRERNKGRTKPY
jgi:hypothetical protein